MLRKKCFRDIKKNLSQFITIFLMIFIGIMAYSGIEAYMDGMTYTADKFYKENNLQDLNVLGTNFSSEDLKKVKNIKGVKDAERKLSVTGTSGDDTLLLNFIESNNISKFYIIEGEKFDNKSGVWLDNFYAIENDIKVGDTITIKYDTFKIKEKVRGLINVPDHLYDVKDESELYPNREDFGFAYLSSNEIPENYIKSMVNLPNYKDYIPYNYIMVDTKTKEKVKEKIEDTINTLAILDIEDTSSYSTYQGEIDEGKTYVGVFSGLFLFIATLSVITTMTRVVNKQRIQIGTLKALGFKDYKIVIHYIGYGFWISLFASICGLIAGYFIIGKTFINLEMSFFEVPNGVPLMNNTSYLVALLMVVVVCIITLFTCKNILKENPAETLRSKVSKVGKNSFKLNKGIFKKLNFSTKWNIRDMFRNKVRSLMGIVGVTGCAILIVCAMGMLDSLNYFVKLEFEDLSNFEYKLTLKDGTNDDLIKYGNNTSQTLGIEIKKNGKRESNNIFVDNSNNLVRFVDKDNKFIKLKSNKGVYVTYKFAELNNYKLGDYVTWHIYGDSKYYKSKIVGFNKDPQNQNMTMTKEYLESLGIKYVPDTLYTNKDLSKVKEIEGVSLIQDKKSLKKSMNNMLETMQTMIVLIIVIAVILGVIIIYNLGILSYTEKEYQFATLKVLGFKDKQIKKIFIKQNNWVAIISIILGLPLGYYLTDFLFKEAIEAHYDFQAHIEIITYIVSALFTFIVSYLVSRFLARKINKIDMVSSLKGDE